MDPTTTPTTMDPLTTTVVKEVRLTRLQVASPNPTPQASKGREWLMPLDGSLHY
jgi:hypothetical protein